MKRSTIYLDAELELATKLEAQRRDQPMAEIIREALREYLDKTATATSPPPGAGEFDSGTTDTADRSEELLEDLGFGRNS